LLNSGDAKYEHLGEPLHVLIEVEALKSEAHARLAAALNEIKKYMTPENDDIRQDQMREMALLNSFDETPDGAPMPQHMVGRGRSSNQSPIIRVGIPPPGAVILNGQQPMMSRGRNPRVIGRSRPGVRHIMPRHATQAPESFTYESYDNAYDAAYEGYPETSGDVYYEYADDYPPPQSAARHDNNQYLPSKADRGVSPPPFHRRLKRSFRESAYHY
jgi:KH domain-containing RNA-binding signal transduction-associated protein 3